MALWLSGCYKQRILQEEEGEAFVVSLCLCKQSQGLLGGKVGRRELNFISLGICHGKTAIMDADGLCGRANKKDSFVFHLQKRILLVTEGPAPRDGLWPCSKVCHPPCKLTGLCWPMKAFQYLLREL